jgi:Peroxisome biogenesis factor 1, N-terminal
VEIPAHLFPDRPLLLLDHESSSLMNMMIDVEIVPYCPAASQVSVVPISSSGGGGSPNRDYDKIRQQVHWLEQYGLLSQVSVIAMHQVLHIRTGQDQEVIPLRVEHIHSPFPSPCWRLVETTELIVLAPEEQEVSSAYNGALRRIPCRQDIIDSAEMELLEQQLDYDFTTTTTSRRIDLPQKTVAIHHHHHRHDDETRLSRSNSRIAILRRYDRSAVVRVLSSAHVPDGCIGTYAAERWWRRRCHGCWYIYSSSIQ